MWSDVQCDREDPALRVRRAMEATFGGRRDVSAAAR